MQFRAGTLGQKALFAALVGMYVLAVGLRLTDDARDIGKPLVGFHFITYGQDNWFVNGVGAAATERRLFWGSELLSVNGVPVEAIERRQNVLEGVQYALGPDVIRAEIGDSNHLVFRCSLPFVNKVHEIDLPVVAQSWRDVMCASGTPFALGALFMLVGLVSFLLRPYEHASWALLVLCTTLAGFVTLIFRISPYEPLTYTYMYILNSTFVLAPLYLAAAMVVPHPLLQRFPRLPVAIFGPGVLFGVICAAINWQLFDTVLPVVLLITTGVSVGRALLAAATGPNRIVRQRARLVLVGCLGFIPPTAVWFAQSTFQTLMVDMRVVLLTVLTFPIALAYITVRHELFSARVAARRSMVYTIAAGLFVLGTVLITSVLTASLGPNSGYWVTPLVVGLVLVPVLHYWPRMDDRLGRWLNPQRARYPELLRECGDELASCTTADAILGVLAVAPGQICNATTAVAFLLPDDRAPEGRLSVFGAVPAADARALRDEPLINLLVTTRHLIRRESIAVQPQYANIAAECHRCMDTLGAEVLLPILRQNRVIGGLAVGPRASGEVYDTVELNVLSMLIQQAVQALMRTEAFETLQAQQQDIADLKRYFPPHIIDRVMEQGGAAEFPSQRKLVTVFFSDLRGFTAFSDTVEPEEVMAVLGEYHRAMGLRIAQFGGTLERFAGDGIMVFFNDPVEQPDHVQRATRMALAMRDNVRQLRESWVRKGYQLDVGMGIHTGYATCGIVGYEGRRDYAVIGNVTNLAARLCDAAGGGEVLVTARVISELGTAFANEPVGELSLKGFHQPQITYRILGAETHV